MPAPRAALALSAAVEALAAAPATAHASPVEVATSRPAKAVVSAPAEVTEGDRFTVKVRVPRGASRVLLQHQETDSLGNRSWEIVTRTTTKRKVAYSAVAGEHDTEAFRARVLVGRHCRAFRADAGVTDKSAPGSSAILQILADGTTTSFASGPLTPGMAQPMMVDLPTPYRLEVRAQDTSPDKVQAYPALGDPELLCTGLD